MTISNDDSNFQQCPKESGAYPHTTNCSLFHMCTFGIHRIYSCIKGFFFNPINGRCQHLSIVRKLIFILKIILCWVLTHMYRTIVQVEHKHEFKTIAWNG